MKNKTEKSNKLYFILRLALALLIVAGGAFGLRQTTVNAASTITVNSVASDATAGNGECTLFEAMTNANANSDLSGGDCAAGAGSDTIKFSVSGDIRTNEYGVHDPAGLTIDGGGQRVALTGSHAGVYTYGRVLRVSANAALTVANITIKNGYPNPSIVSSHRGGGIYNEGALTVRSSTFTRNYAGVGGAIFNLGTLDVADSTFFRNSTGCEILTIRTNGELASSATVAPSSADCRIIRQDSNGGGSAIDNRGTAIIRNTTISGSILAGVKNTGTLTLSNSILTYEPVYGSGATCRNSGTIIAEGVNLVEDGACDFPVGGDPKLALLADNGGWTPTLALLPGSPAIDAGDDSLATATDQRGVARKTATKTASWFQTSARLKLTTRTTTTTAFWTRRITARSSPIPTN